MVKNAETKLAVASEEHGTPMPLRKRDTKSGTVYKRFPSVESALEELIVLSRREIVSRCEIEDEGNPNFVPSECLVSLIRGCRNELASAYFERLYAALMRRILQRLPAAERKGGKQILLKESEIQDGVIYGFQELLASDRTEYVERLDFWEVAFGMALKKLKITVELKVWQRTNRSSPLENPETGEIWEHVSEAADKSDPFDPEELLKKDYRDRLYAAIEGMTPEHRRIIKMCLEGFPAYSTTPRPPASRKC